MECDKLRTMSVLLKKINCCWSKITGRRRRSGSRSNSASSSTRSSLVSNDTLIDEAKSAPLPTVHRSGMTARKSMKTKSGASAVNSRKVESAKTKSLKEVDSSLLQKMALRNTKQSRNTSAELSKTLPDSVSTAGNNHRLPNRKNNAGKVAHRAVTREPVGKNSPTEASDAKQAINDLKSKRIRNMPPTKVYPRRGSQQSSDSSSETQRQNIFLTMNDDLSKSEIFKERGSQKEKECFKTPGRTRIRRSSILSGSDNDYTPGNKKLGKAKKSARNLDSDSQESETKSDAKNSKTESRQTSGGDLSDNIEDDSDFMKTLQTKLSLGPENRKKRWEEKEKARKEEESKISLGSRNDGSHITRPDSIVTRINNKPKRQLASVQRKRKKKLPVWVDDSRGETSSDDDIRSIQSDFDHQPKLAIVPPRRPSTDSSSDEARPMLVGAAKKTYTVEWSPGQRRKCLSPRTKAIIDRPDVPFNAALEDLKRMKRTSPYGSPARSPRPGSPFSSQGSYRGISFQDSSDSDLSDVELIVETEKTVEKPKPKSIDEPVKMPMPVIHKEKSPVIHKETTKQPKFFKSRAKQTITNVPQKTTNVKPVSSNAEPVASNAKPVSSNAKPVSKRPEMTIPVPTSQLQFVDTLCSSESDLEEEVIVSPVPLPIHPVRTGERPISPAQAKPKPKPANIKKPFDPQKVVISVVGTCDNVTKPSIRDKPRVPVPRLSNIGRKLEGVKSGSLHLNQSRGKEKDPKKSFLPERTQQVKQNFSRSEIASVTCRDKQETTTSDLDVPQTVMLKKHNKEVRINMTLEQTHEKRTEGTTSRIRGPKVATSNSGMKDVVRAPHREKRAPAPPKPAVSERETISTTVTLKVGVGKPKCAFVATKEGAEKTLDKKDPLQEGKNTSRSQAIVPKNSKTTPTVLPSAQKETITVPESKSPPRKATSVVLEPDHRKSETTSEKSDSCSVSAPSSPILKGAASPEKSNEADAQIVLNVSKVSRSVVCKEKQISKQKEDSSLPVFTISENVKLGRPRMKQTARKSVSPAPKIIYKEVKIPKENTSQETRTKEQTGTESLQISTESVQMKSKNDGIATATIKMKEVLKNTLSTYKEQLGMTANMSKPTDTKNRAESSTLAGQGKASPGKKNKEDISKNSKGLQKSPLSQDDILSDGESHMLDHTGCDDLPLDLSSIQSFDTGKSSIQSFDTGKSSIQSFDIGKSSIQSFETGKSSIQSFDTGKSQNKKKAAKETEEPPVITIYVPLKQAAATVKQGVLKNSKFWPGSSRRMVKENLEMSESSGSSGSDADYPAPPPKPQKIPKGLKPEAKSRPSRKPKVTKTLKSVEPEKNADVGAKVQLQSDQKEGSKDVSDKDKVAEVPPRRSRRKTRAKKEEPKVGHNLSDNEVVGPVRTLRREIHTPERYKESGMPNLGYIRISSPEGRKSDTSMSPPRKISPVRGKTQTQKRFSVHSSQNESIRPTQLNINTADSNSEQEHQVGSSKEPFTTDNSKQELPAFQKREYKISRNLTLQPFKKRLVLPSPPVSTDSPLDRDVVDNDAVDTDHYQDDTNVDVTDNMDDNVKVASGSDEVAFEETNIIERHAASPKGSHENELLQDRQLHLDSLPNVNNDNQEASLHGPDQSEDIVSSVQGTQDQPDSQLTSKEPKKMPQSVIKSANRQSLKRTKSNSDLHLHQNREVEGMTPATDAVPSSTSSITAQSPSFSTVLDGDDVIWIQTNAPVRYFQGTSAEKLQGTQEEAERVWRMENKVQMFKKDYQIVDLNKIGKERLNLKFFTEFDIEQYRQHIKKKPFQGLGNETSEKFTDEVTTSDDHNENDDDEEEEDDDDDDGESGSEEEVVLHEIEIAKNSAGISRILKIKERKPKRRWRKSKLDESNEDSLLGRSDSVDTTSSVKSDPSRDLDALPESDDGSSKGDEETTEIADEEPETEDETAAQRSSNTKHTVEADVHVPKSEQVFGGEWRKTTQDSDDNLESQDSDDNRETQDSDDDQELLLDHETNRESQDSDDNQELLPDDESKRESQDSEDNQELLPDDESKRESQDSEDNQEVLPDDENNRESQDTEDNEELLPDDESHRESQDSGDNQEVLPDDEGNRESQDSDDNQELLPDDEGNRESQDSEDNQEVLPDDEVNRESQDSEDNQELPEDEINRDTQDSEDNEEVQDDENNKTPDSKNDVEMQEGSAVNTELLHGKEKHEMLGSSNKEEAKNTGQINQENDHEEIDAAEVAKKTLAEEVSKTTLEIKAQSEAAEKAKENNQPTREVDTQDKKIEHATEERNDQNFQQSEKEMKTSPRGNTTCDSEDTEGETVGKTMAGVQKGSSKLPSSLSSSQQGSRAPSRRSSFEGREDKAGDMSEVDFSMLDNPLDTDTEPGLQVNRKHPLDTKRRKVFSLNDTFTRILIK